MSFDKNLRKRSQQLRTQDPALPEGLRDRTLASLPDLKKAKTPMALTRRAALAALAVTGIGLVAAPRLFLSPASAAGIEAAIGKTLTWHFSGWRIQYGKRVRWEIWGRRAPFFYREQIGDNVLLDDGKRRLFFQAPAGPEGFLGPRPGFVLVQKSVGANPKTLADPRAGFLAGLSGDPADWTRDRTDGTRRTLEADATYLSDVDIKEDRAMPKAYVQDTARLEIDTKTSLPSRYSIQRQARDAQEKLTGRETPQAELEAHYDVTLPEGVTQVPQAAQLPRFDMTTPCTAPEAQGESAARNKGLTVVGSVPIRDNEGCLKVHLEHWVGNTHLALGSGTVPFSLSASSVQATDNLGRQYISLLWPGTGSADTLYLCPEEPYLVTDSRPTSLRLTVSVSLEVYERIGTGGRTVALVRENLELTIPLPQTEGSLSWDDPANFTHHVGPHKDFATEKAEARALYFQGVLGNLPNHGTPSPERRQRALYWYRKATEAADRLPQGTSFSNIYRKNIEVLEKTR
ncbi:hypothetical protein [Armatimonas rosea]|uniref:Uncharacterized protein n=1 Tax=Armatimonas rosea TaxID=685828 RepID=A0A7W9SWB7_ARMRO|nr:hypothetical protein [Armatimonas rosea]MBB6053114.1 hypothetical protein [Armatimonas rosea]